MTIAQPVGGSASVFADEGRISRLAVGLIALQAFATAVALAGVSILIGRLEIDAIAGERALLVQIIAVEDDVADQRGEAALSILLQIQGVERADFVSRESALALLAPWMGELPSDEIPLPTTIEVILERGTAIAAADVRTRLASIPDVFVYDQGEWVAPPGSSLDALIVFARVLAACLLVAISATAVIAIHFMLRTQRETVGLLALLGAERGFIARPLALRALIIAGVGGVSGTVLGAGAVIIGLAAMLMPSDIPITGILNGTWRPLVGLCVLPLCAAVVSYAAAWLYVIVQLKE